MPTHLIHRGLAKKNFKENTISAFKHCFKKNYGIETDIQCTKDDKIVCFHDFNLKKKFKINKKIKDLNYEEIRKISLKFNSEIPLLDDLLKLNRSKFPLMIELKTIFSKKNLISKLQDKASVDKLINILSQRYEKRKGGYSRVIRAGYRYGDDAPMAVIELVDRDVEAKKVDIKKKTTEKEKTATENKTNDTAKQAKSKK